MRARVRGHAPASEALHHRRGVSEALRRAPFDSRASGGEQRRGAGSSRLGSPRPEGRREPRRARARARLRPRVLAPARLTAPKDDETRSRLARDLGRSVTRAPRAVAALRRTRRRPEGSSNGPTALDRSRPASTGPDALKQRQPALRRTPAPPPMRDRQQLDSGSLRFAAPKDSSPSRRRAAPHRDLSTPRAPTHRAPKDAARQRPESRSAPPPHRLVNAR